MRAVKLFNIVAGILLIGGTLALVVGLIFRDPAPKPSPAADRLPATASAGPIWLGARPDSRIVETRTADGHALFTTEDAQAVRQVFLVDLATGAVREIRPGQP